MTWLDFNLKVACAPALVYSGVRKIVRQVSHELTWDELMNLPMGYEDLCYSAKTKRNQLMRTYWNQDGVDAAIDRLMSRPDKDHTSVGIQLQSGIKDSRSMGHCMQNMVITKIKDKCYVDLYYRSTEATQKFGADLVLFSEVLPEVFDKLGFTPEGLRLQFSNAYFSAMFTPIICAFAEDQVEFFREVNRNDARFFRSLALATRRYFQDDHNYTYRTRVKMFEYWKENVEEDENLKELLFQV